MLFANSAFKACVFIPYQGPQCENLLQVLEGFEKKHFIQGPPPLPQTHLTAFRVVHGPINSQVFFLPLRSTVGYLCDKSCITRSCNGNNIRLDVRRPGFQQVGKRGLRVEYCNTQISLEGLLAPLVTRNHLRRPATQLSTVTATSEELDHSGVTR